jgi:hypothetical protein
MLAARRPQICEGADGWQRMPPLPCPWASARGTGRDTGRDGFPVRYGYVSRMADPSSSKTPSSLLPAAQTQATDHPAS